MQISREQNKRQAQNEGSAANTANLIPAILAAATAALQHAQNEEQPRLIGLDVLEKAQQFEIRADLPGVAKEDIILQADGNVITLAVEREKTEEQVAEGLRVHRRERASSYAPRTIRLPESADLGQVRADVENGVLDIVIPKSQKEKQRTIKVGSKAGSSS